MKKPTKYLYLLFIFVCFFFQGCKSSDQMVKLEEKTKKLEKQNVEYKKTLIVMQENVNNLYELKKQVAILTEKNNALKESIKIHEDINTVLKKQNKLLLTEKLIDAWSGLE